MKITKSRIKQLIKEELQKILYEQFDPCAEEREATGVPHIYDDNCGCMPKDSKCDPRTGKIIPGSSLREEELEEQ